MKKYYLNITYTILFLLAILIWGCEKEIKIDFPEHQSNMVVEGWIEQGNYARVILTLSAPFFAPIDSNNLTDYSVTRAKVTLSSETQTEILTLKSTDVYFPPYYYTSTEIRGQTDENYSLEISYGGRIFTASTTIPEIVETDSIWFEKHSTNDTLGVVGIKFTDPANTVNYYRILTKILGKEKRFIPTLTSTYSDKAFNGKTIAITLSKGSANILDIEDNRFFNMGDTIVFKLCSIDKAHYDFWNTIQNQALTTANPFAISHEEIKTNISDGFGIWGGYAVHYDTIIAK